jgi:GGDEF domain-containing protein
MRKADARDFKDDRFATPSMHARFIAGHQKVTAEYPDSGKLVRLRISAGIRRYQRDLDREALLRCADRALYRAKSSSKGNVLIFDGSGYFRQL